MKHYTPCQHDTNYSIACSNAFTHSATKSATWPGSIIKIKFDNNIFYNMKTWKKLLSQKIIWYAWNTIKYKKNKILYRDEIISLTKKNILVWYEIQK